MDICKYYVNGKCNAINCKFSHVDNICRNYFFGECTRVNCKFSHQYKLENKGNNNNNKDNNKGNNKGNNKRNHIKNTESFIPNNNEPDIRILFNKPITKGNEVSICTNIFTNNIFDINLNTNHYNYKGHSGPIGPIGPIGPNGNKSTIYDRLLSEISNDVFKPWHGDSHLIADDSHEIDWKSKSPTFEAIIKQLCSFFCMTPGATRLNYYGDSLDWKPYHHDAAALKPNKANTQNITVGVSFGETREISFESTHKELDKRIRINFPLDYGVVYSFGNKVNVDFRHGIPQLKYHTNNGRISIIVWGYSSLLS